MGLTAIVTIVTMGQVMPKRKPTPLVIRAAREAKGLTRAALANAVGVDVSTVAGWESLTERARGQLPIERVARLLSELEISPAEFAS